MTAQTSVKIFDIKQPQKGTDIYERDQKRIKHFQENKEIINQQFDKALQDLVEQMDVSHYGALETEEDIKEASLKVTG